MKLTQSTVFILSFILLSASVSVTTLEGRTYEGLIEPYRSVEVSSQVESIVMEMPVREGDKIEKGAVLAKLYSIPEELEVDRARAAVEMREFENRGAQNLFADNLISEDEAMEKRIELNIARIQLSQAEEEVARRRIESPISGIVVERFFEEGELVRSGDALFEIFNLEKVRLQLYLSVDEAKDLEEGEVLPITVPKLGSDWTAEGTVEFIDPRVDPASGLMRVRLELPNSDGSLKAGLRAQLTSKSIN